MLMWILIAAILLTSSPAWSQQPLPRFAEAGGPKQCHSTEAQQCPDYKQGDTQDAPLFVKAIAPDKTEKEIEKETQESKEKAATDWWLMVFTGAVAFFTAALVGVTIALWRAGEKQIAVTKQSADAAQSTASAALTQAESIKNTERPYLLIEKIIPKN
jgi:hypothetical protein